MWFVSKGKMNLKHSCGDPDKFNIPSYWDKCSKENKLFSFMTTIENTHIGAKDLYLKYSN